MPTPVSDNTSVTPTISVHAHLVTGSGFLPDHNVTVRITPAGEDISDYLAYLVDGNGYLHCEGIVKLFENTCGSVDVSGLCGGT